LLVPGATRRDAAAAGPGRGPRHATRRRRGADPGAGPGGAQGRDRQLCLPPRTRWGCLPGTAPGGGAGGINGDTVTVEAGLAPGERIATHGAFKLEIGRAHV